MLFLHERSGHRSVSDCFVFFVVVLGGVGDGVWGRPRPLTIWFICVRVRIYTPSHTGIIMLSYS